MSLSRRRSTCVSLIAGVALLVGAVPVRARAAIEIRSVVLHVELIEQAACLVSQDTYRVLFEMRTIYVNEGRLPVSIAIATERIVGASFEPAGDPGASAADVLSFAVPAGVLASAPDQAVTARAIEPGWAESGKTSVWLPMTTGSDAARLTPGGYTARFEVGVMATEGGRGAAALQALRLSTAPLAVTIHTPTQVQECGSFSETLPVHQPAETGLTARPARGLGRDGGRPVQ